jgi:hypothetical protein
MREQTDRRKASADGDGTAERDAEVSMGVAQDQLGDLVARARITGQRTVLMRYGKAVAAIVPIADYEILAAAS